MAEQKVDWEQIVPLFGTMPDATLASMFGLSRQRIGQKRKKYKIESYVREEHDPDIPKHELEHSTIPQIMERYNLSRSKVQEMRVSAGVRRIHPVSKVRVLVDELIESGAINSFTDETLGKIYSINPYSIRRYRLQAGIKRRKHDN